jgi:transcriptional regulator with XRE-family HTH domain
MYRAVMPRKLNGAEIKFLRSAIGCKAKDVAEKLDFAPEHLSRCENDSKLLSPLAEKWFRFFVIVKALDKTRRKAADFTAIRKHADPDTLLEMKIESTWDPSESLCLRLTHRKSEVQPDLFDDGEWENEQQRDRAA